MPNIAIAFKEEITRLSRREVRKNLLGLKKISIQYRKDIAELKRRLAKLQGEVRRLERKAGQETPVQGTGDGTQVFRFNAKGFASRRKRTGLSAGDYGKLLGVSAQTIYNWEHGKARPRSSQLARLNTLRRVGKREAAARLKGLKQGHGKGRKRPG